MMNSTTPQPAAIAAPAAGTYRIDAARSAIAFTTRHLFGLGTVHGTLTLRDGDIHVADPVHESSARARISAVLTSLRSAATQRRRPHTRHGPSPR
jgi:polyisoprenoid-binding protein YceI